MNLSSEDQASIYSVFGACSGWNLVVNVRGVIQDLDRGESACKVMITAHINIS